MTAAPINSAQPSKGVSTQPIEHRHLREDAIARFRQTLAGIEPATANIDPARIDSTKVDSTNVDSGNRPDSEHRDPSASLLTMTTTVGSLHYSLVHAEVTAGPATAPNTADATRLIEQATSVMLERATRSDECRFIVSLDHAIAGGASAEFVRDGAFLHVRLLARNDASYRSMWTHRAELQERLAASTGLLTRVEIFEVYGDGSPA